MYYAFDKNGKKIPVYTDCNNGFPSIDAATFYVGEGGHVEDEDGNIVWTWEVK